MARRKARNMGLICMEWRLRLFRFEQAAVQLANHRFIHSIWPKCLPHWYWRVQTQILLGQAILTIRGICLAGADSAKSNRSIDWDEWLTPQSIRLNLENHQGIHYWRDVSRFAKWFKNGLSGSRSSISKFCGTRFGTGGEEIRESREEYPNPLFTTSKWWIKPWIYRSFATNNKVRWNCSFSNLRFTFWR
jgi:hypothetical protein